MKNKIKWLYLCCSLCCLYSCLEEIPIETNFQSDVNVEEILIVEATITSELKQQQILLSRGKSFGNDNIDNFERNAVVSISDNLGNTFTFQNNENGTYLSTQPFAAQQGRSYTLSIDTASGETFESDQVESAGISTIDDLYAERIIRDDGTEGMAIFVDSSNPESNLNNYRYTYDETYKIIAPNWTSSEFEIIREETEIIRDENTGEVTDILYPDVRLVPRAQEERVCYNTVLSTDIILSDGLELNSNRVGRNLIRFINRDNPILSHRYSILIKQFLQSTDAANFYDTLLQFSQNEDLFSTIQPGLLEGNIKAKGNTQTTIVGYFEVASVSEERLFFNYEDFFPNEDLPPFFETESCDNFIAPILENPERDGFVPDDVRCALGLIPQIKNGNIEFYLRTDSPPDQCQGPYFVTQGICGDCTKLGSNVVPEFWVE